MGGNYTCAPAVLKTCKEPQRGGRDGWELYLHYGRAEDLFKNPGEEGGIGGNYTCATAALKICLRTQARRPGWVGIIPALGPR